MCVWRTYIYVRADEVGVSVRMGAFTARTYDLSRRKITLFVARVLLLFCVIYLAYFVTFGRELFFPNTHQDLAIINDPHEWPQWGGPTRDFKSVSKKLANRWPADGPRKLWVRPLGEGHSSIVSDSGRLYTMYRKGAREYVICLEARSGRTLWEHSYAAPLYAKMDMSYGSGPHSTPVGSGGFIFLVGTTGKLLCLNKTTGKEVWGHDLWSDLSGTVINGAVGGVHACGGGWCRPGKRQPILETFRGRWVEFPFQHQYTGLG